MFANLINSTWDLAGEESYNSDVVVTSPTKMLRFPPSRFCEALSWRKHLRQLGDITHIVPQLHKMYPKMNTLHCSRKETPHRIYMYGYKKRLSFSVIVWTVGRTCCALCYDVLQRCRRQAALVLSAMVLERDRPLEALVCSAKMSCRSVDGQKRCVSGVWCNYTVFVSVWVAAGMTHDVMHLFSHACTRYVQLQEHQVSPVFFCICINNYSLFPIYCFCNQMWPCDVHSHAIIFCTYVSVFHFAFNTIRQWDSSHIAMNRFALFLVAEFLTSTGNGFPSNLLFYLNV